MKRINSRFGSLLFVFMLMAALVLSFVPIEARADIDEIIIGVGVDADTLNPQEQTTTLQQPPKRLQILILKLVPQA